MPRSLVRAQRPLKRCAVAALILSLCAAAPAKAGLPPGLAFTLAAADGRAPLSSSELKGKVVLLEFWTTHCTPCRVWKPWFEELQKRYAKRGLVVLAVNNGEAKAAVEKHLSAHPTTLRALLDPSSSLMKALRLKGEPSMALFDTNDTLVWSASGFGPATKDDLSWRIDLILPGDPGRVPIGGLER